MKYINVLILFFGFLLAQSAFSPECAEAKNRKSGSKSHHHTSKHSKSQKYESRETSRQLVRMSMALLRQYCPEYAQKNARAAMNYVERKAAYMDHFNEQDFAYTLDKLSYYTFDNLLYEYLTGDGDDEMEESVFDDVSLRIRAIRNINSWLGTPYRYAGRNRKGIDCSNFTSMIYSDIVGEYFPAGADAQSRMFKPIRKLDDLRFGDIMFFASSSRSNRIGHSAIYIGNGLFAHSSSYKKRGVMYTHISESRYMDRFQFAGRLLKSRWTPVT